MNPQILILRFIFQCCIYTLFFQQIKKKLLIQTFTDSTLLFFHLCLHPRSHPQQLLSALLCNFPGEVESATCYLSSQRMRWTEAILLQGVVCVCVGGGLTLLLHYISSSGCNAAFCPRLVRWQEVAVWGLVPATYCDMLTKRAGTSRFREIHRKKEDVAGKKRLLHWKMAAVVAAISSSLLPAAFLYFYLMGRRTSSLQPPPPPPPSGVGQIARVGLTKPLPTTGSQSPLRRLFECHVIDVMSAVGPRQESDNLTTTDCTNGQHRQHNVQLRLCNS